MLRYYHVIIITPISINIGFVTINSIPDAILFNVFIRCNVTATDDT